MALDTSRRDALLAEIRQTLGLVPSFLGQLEFDPETLEHHWRLMQKYAFGESHLPAKHRELIGIAVAAALHCRFCITAHTEFARWHGASEEEILEAAYLADYTAGWSAFVDGRLQDLEGLEQELLQLRKHREATARPGALTFAPEAQATPEARNSECWRRFVTAVFNRGEEGASERFVSPRMRDHAPFPFQPGGGAGIEAGLAVFREAFPDMQWSIEELVASGDHVACQLLMRGTHRGDFQGIPPTGQLVAMGSTHLVRFEDGLQIEHRGTFDVLGLLRQLGASLPT